MFPGIKHRMAGAAARVLDRTVEFATLGEYCVEWELEEPAPPTGSRQDRSRPLSRRSPRRSRRRLAAQAGRQPCLAVQAGLIRRAARAQPGPLFHALDDPFVAFTPEHEANLVARPVATKWARSSSLPGPIVDQYEEQVVVLEIGSGAFQSLSGGAFEQDRFQPRSVARASSSALIRLRDMLLVAAGSARSRRRAPMMPARRGGAIRGRRRPPAMIATVDISWSVLGFGRSKPGRRERIGPKNDEGPPGGGPSYSNRRRPTLPGPRGPSTIGAEGLNCSVRNGKRCFPLALTTENGGDRRARRAFKTAQLTDRLRRMGINKSVKPSDH